MGWDGLALIFSHLIYWMLRYLYIWEVKFSKAPQTYKEIKEEIANEWIKFNKNA